MRQQFLTELMRVFPNTVHRGDSKVKINRDRILYGAFTTDQDFAQET
jgi:hypothetical protein